ncbi:MAG: hypothetical protein IJI68_06485 [Eggerthellaceae bacterium]|nr:hypothetical protein [Eggerthellaceae bacterium]
MKTILRSPAFTVALFALAVVLLGFGTVGAVQAAPTLTSGDYRAQVQLTDIETAIVENGTVREGDNKLLTTLLADNGDEKLKIGKAYKTSLAVRNTGDIDEYVRVTVRAYWMNKAGTKVLDVDPSLIKLKFGTGSGWTIDESASKGERTVLYYSKSIKPGQDTSSFVDSVTIDGAVATAVTDRNYDYNDLQFRVEAEADAVQTHNGEKAMTSAWGRTN